MNEMQIHKNTKDLIKLKNLCEPVKASKKFIEMEQKLKRMSQKCLKAQSIQTFIAELTLFLKSNQLHEYQQQRSQYNIHFFEKLFPTKQPRFKQNNYYYHLGTFHTKWRQFFCVKDIISYISNEIKKSYSSISRDEQQKENFKKQIVARSLERAAERNRKQMECNTWMAIFGGSLSSIFGCLPLCLAIGYCSCAICLNSSQYLAIECLYDWSFIQNQTLKLSSIFKDLANDKIPLSRAIQKMRFMKADKCLKSILQPLKEFVEELLRFDFCCEYEVKFDKQLAEKQTVVNLFFERAKESTNYEQIRQFFTQRNNFIKYCLSNQSSHHEANKKSIINFPPFLIGDLKYKKISIFYQDPVNVEQVLKKLKRSYYFCLSSRIQTQQAQIANNCFGDKYFKMVNIDLANSNDFTQQVIAVKTKQLIPLLIETKAKLIIFGSYHSLYMNICRIFKKDKKYD